VPGASAGRGCGDKGTRGRVCVLGPPAHSRLKADGGLHPGPGQGLPAALHLPLVELGILGLKGAKWAAIRRQALWGLTTHPGLMSPSFGW